MTDEKTPRSIRLIRDSVADIRQAVLPSPKAAPEQANSDVAEDLPDSIQNLLKTLKTRVPNAYEQSVAAAVQSIAQSAAIAIGDATDMMRNASTVQLTAIGAAEAKWIETPSNGTYKDIIDNSIDVLNRTVDTFEKIGESVYTVLEQFDIDESNGGDTSTDEGGDGNDSSREE